MKKVYHKLPLSVDHLEAAVLFATQARDFEHGRAKPHLFHPRSEHRTASIGCVLSTVAYLEASINEFFSDAADERVPERLAGGVAAIERFGKLWQLGASRSSILDKYDTALALCDRPVFSKGVAPYQPVALLVKLRNALTHFVPEWEPGGGWPHEEAELAKLSKSLRGSFPENGLAEDFEPYFPYRCLGYGSSKWAVTQSIAFVKDFRSRVGLGFSPTYILESVGKL